MNNRYNDYYIKHDSDQYQEYRKNSYGIKKINEKKIKVLRNKVLIKVSLVGLIASTIIVGNMIINKPQTLSPVIPEGYIQMYIEISVGDNETLEDIAKQYYNSDSYPEYYTNLDNYMKLIAEKNEITSNNIPRYQNIVVPVIVQENNVYLERISQLSEELKTIEDEWVSYKVQTGDTIYSIAWNGAGDANEANDNVNRIIEENGLTSSNIVIGDIIKIINPEIGEIKKEIAFLNEKLNESLKVDKVEEISMTENNKAR